MTPILYFSSDIIDTTFIYGFLIIFFIAIIGLPLFAVVGGIAFFKYEKRTKKLFDDSVKFAFLGYIAAHGGTYIPGKSQMGIGNSLKHGEPYNVLQTTTSSGSYAWVYYVAYKGSTTTDDRTVVAISVPDIMTHFFIKSNLNTQSSEDTMEIKYDSSQVIQLEGNFSKTFTVYSPNGTQDNLLELLAPDVMDYILENYGYDDIEIVNNTLCVYTYGRLEPATALKLLDMTQQLVNKMKLRVQDSKPQSMQGHNELIARSADTLMPRTYLKKSHIAYITVAEFILMAGLFAYNRTVFQFAIFPLVIANIIASIFHGSRQTKLQNMYKLQQNTEKNIQNQQPGK
jgi:hypothetical protein